MIATLGEALVDLIEQKDGLFRACLGGSVCNFSLALARQNVRVRYLNPLSADTFGDRFFSLLANDGVDLGKTPRSPSPTSLAVVSLDEQGSPTYAFHRQDVADRDIDADTLAAGFPEDMNLLHTGGLALVSADLEKVLATVSRAAALGAIISIDANLRPMAVTAVGEYVDGVWQALRQAHIAKVSDEDLEVLGCAGASRSELTRLFFDDTALQLLAVTRGAHGATLLTRQYAVTQTAPQNIVVVDTVGAGDCFHAGLIAYLLHAGVLGSAGGLAQLDIDVSRSALRHAVASATLNIMRAGCDPARWDQVQTLSAAFAED